MIISKVVYGVLLIGSMMSAAMSEAATYYVAKTGNDGNACTQAQNQATPKLSIYQGWKCLSAGDTLIVKSGVYTESIKTDIRPVPGGTSWASPVTVKANPGDVVTIQPTAPSDGAFYLAGINTKYIILDGFFLDGANVNWQVVKICSGAHHIRIQNSELKNAPQNGIIIADPGSDSNELINLNVHDNHGSHGIYIWSQYNLIKNCHVHHNGKYGIQLYDGFQGLVNFNTVIQCLIHDNSTFDTGNGGLIVGGNGNQVFNNIIYAEQYAGIRVQYSNPNNVQIYNNTLYNTGTYGIFIEGAALGTIIKNNIVRIASSVIVNDAGAQSTLAANLVADPLFVNAGGADFRLQSTSPAINTGVTIPLVTHDYAGIKRPQGSAYDIGAYEYVTCAGRRS